MKPKFKDCPFCGSQPKHDAVKHRNAGEPYWVVSLRCTGCGVQMATVANDNECDEASKINHQRYEENKSLISRGELVAHVVIKGRLMSRWNTRFYGPQEPLQRTDL
jgi:hypothetical protein